MTKHRTLLVFLVALALFTTGCFQGMAESQVRKSLTKLLGPADKYEVKITNTSDAMLLNGEVGDLDILAVNVRTKDGLVIHRFAVDAGGIKLAKDKKSVEKVERASFELDIKQEDLSTLARKKAKNLADLQVLLSPENVALMLPARALNQSLDVSLKGSLSVQDGVRILFDASGFSLGPLTLSDGVTRGILQRVNPIADLSKLPVPVHIDLLQVGSGILVVRGRLFGAPAEGEAHPPPPVVVPSPTPSPSPTKPPDPDLTPMR